MKVSNQEQAALRSAFEEHSALTLDWTNFRSTTEGDYACPEIQRAWHWCNLGYLAGKTAQNNGLEFQ